MKPLAPAPTKPLRRALVWAAAGSLLVASICFCQQSTRNTDASAEANQPDTGAKRLLRTRNRSQEAGTETDALDKPAAPIPAGGSAAGGSAEPTLRSFPLKLVEAAELANVLRALYDEKGLKVEADSRSNRLIVRGPEALITELSSLVDALDAADIAHSETPGAPDAAASGAPNFARATQPRPDGSDARQVDQQTAKVAWEYRVELQRDPKSQRLDKMVKQLEALVREAFQARQQLHSDELKLMRQRLDIVERRLANREKLMDQIISRRVDELLRNRGESRSTKGTGNLRNRRAPTSSGGGAPRRNATPSGGAAASGTGREPAADVATDPADSGDASGAPAPDETAGGAAKFNPAAAGDPIPARPAKGPTTQELKTNNSKSRGGSGNRPPVRQSASPLTALIPSGAGAGLRGKTPFAFVRECNQILDRLRGLEEMNLQSPTAAISKQLQREYNLLQTLRREFKVAKRLVLAEVEAAKVDLQFAEEELAQTKKLAAHRVISQREANVSHSKRLAAQQRIESAAVLANLYTETEPLLESKPAPRATPKSSLKPTGGTSGKRTATPPKGDEAPLPPVEELKSGDSLAARR